MPALPPTGPEIDQLKRALLDAFTLDDLRQLLRIQLDVDLEHLVPTLGQNGDQIAHSLVRAYAAAAPQRFNPQSLAWHLAIQSLLQVSRAFIYQRPGWAEALERRLAAAETRTLALQLSHPA